MRNTVMVCHGMLPIGPPCYCPHHLQHSLILYHCPHTQILSASCTRVDFFSGIQWDILLRTKPFLVFYNRSLLAATKQ